MSCHATVRDEQQPIWNVGPIHDSNFLTGRTRTGGAPPSAGQPPQCLRANRLGVLLACLRSLDDQPGNALGQWVVTIFETKHDEGALIGIFHALDVVGLKGRVLQQPINRHRRTPTGPTPPPGSNV
jgi:hypothetical protein